MELISWQNSKYWRSYDQKSDALSSWVFAKSAIKMGQIQMGLSQVLKIQIKKFLSLYCILKSLVFNTIKRCQNILSNEEVMAILLKIDMSAKLRPNQSSVYRSWLLVDWTWWLKSPETDLGAPIKIPMAQIEFSRL